MSHNAFVDEFNTNGYAVIENFLTPEEISAVFEAGQKLCTEAPSDERKIFNASRHEGKRAQSREEYFLNSSDKIRFFFEEGALDSNGDLLVDPLIALNKVGHALHIHHPTFRAVTVNDRVRDVCKKLGFRRPAIPQSMYIYKNPGIGGEVKPHQDANYLHTEPNSIIGFWIPLEDATIENGCLWFIKGSHRDGLKRRYVRNAHNIDNGDLLTYDRPAPVYNDADFVPVPVKKGSLVLIHGFAVHKSDLNKSPKSRHAYTFHIMETDNVVYSKENWLQLPAGQSFDLL